MLQKAKFLYKLYQLKALGYEYIKPFEFDTNLNLPQQNLNLTTNLLENCHLCPLCKSRKNIIVSSGSKNASLMIINEYPSVDENTQIYHEKNTLMIKNMIENVLKMDTNDVYFTHFIKCKPSNHQTIEKSYFEACKNFLLSEINELKPKVILLFGLNAYHYLTQDFESNFNEIRGEIYEFLGAKLIPTFHPNFLLRNPSLKQTAMQDILRVKELLK